jgi:hypothetical protein
MCVDKTQTHLLNHNNYNKYIRDIFLIYNEQDVTFLNLYISITLYKFRVEPPPIIRSWDCTYSFWYL